MTTNHIPPLHALSAFEAAARLGSFARAADELCVTRSAISHRIQLLEQQLGMPLFLRDSRAIRLTDKGQTYLLTVRQALESLSEFSALNSGRASAPRVTISSPPTFARVVLLPRLKDFADRHPEVEVAINLAIPLLDLNAGDADVEIRYGTVSIQKWRVAAFSMNRFPCGKSVLRRRPRGICGAGEYRKGSLVAQRFGTVEALVRGRRPALERAAERPALRRFGFAVSVSRGRPRHRFGAPDVDQRIAGSGALVSLFGHQGRSRTRYLSYTILSAHWSGPAWRTLSIGSISHGAGHCGGSRCTGRLVYVSIGVLLPTSQDNAAPQPRTHAIPNRLGPGGGGGRSPPSFAAAQENRIGHLGIPANGRWRCGQKIGSSFRKRYGWTRPFRASPPALPRAASR